jgi:hypothetical protein
VLVNLNERIKIALAWKAQQQTLGMDDRHPRRDSTRHPHSVAGRVLLRVIWATTDQVMADLRWLNSNQGAQVAV